MVSNNHSGENPEHLKPPKGHVAVIGGGIIGACSALYLHRSGWKVTLIEKDRFGQGSSHGNCGLIVPSHVLPLNMPQNLIAGIKWLFKKDAPLHIALKFNPNLFRWLLRFALGCNRRQVKRSATGRAALLNDAVAQYESLLSLVDLPCDWEKRGVLYIFRQAHELIHHRDVDRQMRSYGTEQGRLLDREELLRLEPSLGRDVAGAWLYSNSAHLRPDLLMASFKSYFQQAGISILEDTEVTSFQSVDGMAHSAVTTKGLVDAHQFVLATGAWTGLLGSMLGSHIPIQPGKGYSVTMARPHACPTIPCMLEADHVVATPWKSGFRLGGTMEFSGYDQQLNRPRVNALYRGYRKYFATQDVGPPQEEWWGWRPMTPDGLPIIDRSPKFKNVLIAAGHNMLGLGLGPITGQLVAEMINGENPRLDVSPYRLDRFGVKPPLALT